MDRELFVEKRVPRVNRTPRQESRSSLFASVLGWTPEHHRRLPLLDQPPLVKAIQPITVLDRREAMGNDNDDVTP